MSLPCQLKHLVHCTALLIFVVLTSILFWVNNEKLIVNETDDFNSSLPVIVARIVAYLMLLLSLPFTIAQLLGLTLLNPFYEPNKTVNADYPFICFRVVTRGLFKDLVKCNLDRNLKTCYRVFGSNNFRIEIVTDDPIGVVSQPLVVETVVPESYQSKHGTLYKARALQYCLEPEINSLRDEDWIVHLDEETIITEDSIRGILIFAKKGSHEMGQGVITYTDDEVPNWLTTIPDFIRVTQDYGYLRFQTEMVHRVLFGFKGSFVVIRAGFEKAVTFDQGPEGSITEDLFFAFRAREFHGATVDFIRGRMCEKSPFNITDFLKQRMRWLRGNLLLMCSPKISLSTKLFHYMEIISSFLAILTIAQSFVMPASIWPPLVFLFALRTGLEFYGFYFGAFMSLHLSKLGLSRYILILIGIACLFPFYIITYAIVCCMVLFSPKGGFYIVDKALNKQK